MSNLNNCIQFFIVLCLIFINNYCNARPNNSRLSNQHLGLSTSTPWPELGQRRPYKANELPKSNPVPIPPPTWVKPANNTGTNAGNGPPNYSASTQPKRDYISSPKPHLVGPNPTTSKNTTPILPMQPKRDFVSSPRTNIVSPTPVTPKSPTQVKPTEPKRNFINPKYTTAKPIKSAIQDFFANEARL
ncbi:PREDICTED: proteoglycan 4-like isoform X2 [Nicrophorus vespilloides]|uniref:Proteoglycan 4-like isoform X2 n=1 Tax=Nicrophorus vespilloides TaxID=110193 RepID=A0ABM1MK02_NICVS|nr:PREDICTED: proteoglycan 4-like isoform X2 [Nicrophorus vespilloides]